MKYFLNGTWVNDLAISQLPDGATALDDEQWGNRQAPPAGYVPPAPTKAQRITALLAPYKLERISIQMIVGMAEMRADLTALQTLGVTTREADLANSFTRNTAYRVARTLENACLAIEAGA